MSKNTIEVLIALSEAGRRLRMTPIVDDDFPDVLSDFDAQLALSRQYLDEKGAEIDIEDTDEFIVEFRAELNRARLKFPGRRIMTIALAEEFGELAKAVLDEPLANVRKEAIQCAVMAARVALDGDESTDAWREAKGLGRTGTN